MGDLTKSQQEGVQKEGEGRTSRQSSEEARSQQISYSREESKTKPVKTPSKESLEKTTTDLPGPVLDSTVKTGEESKTVPTKRRDTTAVSSFFTKSTKGAQLRPGAEADLIEADHESDSDISEDSQGDSQLNQSIHSRVSVKTDGSRSVEGSVSRSPSDKRMLDSSQGGDYKAPKHSAEVTSQAIKHSALGISGEQAGTTSNSQSPVSSREQSVESTPVRSSTLYTAGHRVGGLDETPQMYSKTQHSPDADSPQKGGIRYSSETVSTQQGDPRYSSETVGPQKGDARYSSETVGPQKGDARYSSDAVSPQKGGTRYSSETVSPQKEGTRYSFETVSPQKGDTRYSSARTTPQKTSRTAQIHREIVSVILIQRFFREYCVRKGLYFNKANQTQETSGVRFERMLSVLVDDRVVRGLRLIGGFVEYLEERGLDYLRL
jgi:hypothetical protein